MTILLMLGIAHVLGDYLFQPERLAKAKTQKLRWMLLHAGIYGTMMLTVFLCAEGEPAFWGWASLTLTHFVIDTLRAYWWERKWKGAMGRLNLFCLDQLLHVAAIAAVGMLLLRPNETALLGDLKTTHGFWTALVCASLVCAIWDPAAVLVRKVFALFPSTQSVQPAETVQPADTVQPTETVQPTQAVQSAEAAKSEVRSGELIGKLERVIIAALVLCGQYSAIGFVLTAKSVARFKQIETDRDFAERYLVGTLVSAAVALLAALGAKALL